MLGYLLNLHLSVNFVLIHVKMQQILVHSHQFAFVMGSGCSQHFAWTSEVLRFPFQVYFGAQLRKIVFHFLMFVITRLIAKKQQLMNIFVKLHPVQNNASVSDM